MSKNKIEHFGIFTQWNTTRKMNSKYRNKIIHLNILFRNVSIWETKEIQDSEHL